ncbi:MAG: hypothetical protein ABFS24_14970 [Pseudomonadota bacterium]
MTDHLWLLSFFIVYRQYLAVAILEKYYLTLLYGNQLVSINFLTKGQDYTTDIGQRLLSGHHGTPQFEQH